MRFILFLFIFLPGWTSGQKFQLTVLNGYGSGSYSPGDTLNIWAREEKLIETFKVWSGDTIYLADPGEWHTRLLMPAKNISVAANFINLPVGAKLTFERMKGRDTLKPVQYYFPAKGKKMKALVWIFHGSGGNFNSFSGMVEGVSIIKTLMVNDYAVAISECDESTYRMDFNGDGNTRWEFPLSNNTNRDMQNHVQFRDTFIARGYMDAALPQMGVGFSAGGSFALFNGWVMKFVKGISFCAPGLNFIADNSKMPTQWFMSLNDDHPDVGKEGNDTALIHFNKFQSRGICSRFYMYIPFPCFPEYFKRIPGVDSLLSAAIFNEFKTMTALNNQNYFRLNPGQIKLILGSNPVKYPAILSLRPDQLQELESQINVILALHHPHSHFNAKMIRFLDDDLCKLSTPQADIQINLPFKLFPNPALDRVSIVLPLKTGKNQEIRIYDISGKCKYQFHLSNIQGEMHQLDLKGLSPGTYSVTLSGDGGYFGVEKLVIIR